MAQEMVLSPGGGFYTYAMDSKMEMAKTEKRRETETYLQSTWHFGLVHQIILLAPRQANVGAMRTTIYNYHVQ